MRCCTGILVRAGMVCWNGIASAQSQIPSAQIPSAQKDSTTSDPVTSDRAMPITDTANQIARNLWSTRSDPAVQANLPVFRAQVTVYVRPLPVAWHLTEKPGPLNPRFNLYHQEHLMMTTPEAFRTSTFYPIGVGFDPATVVNAAKKVWRDWQTARIRNRIAEELAALERARADDVETPSTNTP